MAEAKLKPIEQTVSEYIKSLPADKQADCKKLSTICKKISGKKGVMWYGGMVGYGKYSYKYASGHSGESFPLGFSFRKQVLTIYAMGAIQEQPELLEKLGKFKAGKGCLYVKSLADVDEKVLTKLMTQSYKQIMQKYK